jgi:hypothetical protein
MYIITEKATGRVIRAGDSVTSFRGNVGVFEKVERGPQEHYGEPKVAVRLPDGRLASGRNACVWDLEIEHVAD